MQHLTSSSLFLSSLPQPTHHNSQPQEQSSSRRDILFLSLSSSSYSSFSSADTIMSSILESFQKRSVSFMPSKPLNEDLPVSQTKPKEKGLRRRLSSISLRMNPISSTTASFNFIPRSKSMSALGESAGGSIRKWWDWGWAWIQSRKPMFAKDLEMNEEETAMLGSHNKGSWKHVFYKVRSEFKKLVGSSNNVGLPQTFRYDSYSYSKNFDDGKRSEA